MRGSGRLCLLDLQRKIRVVVLRLPDGRAAGDAAEGVVAEAAAAVAAGDDAAELADHRLIVNFPRKLAVGTVSVDLSAEKQSKYRLSSFLRLLYTLCAQISSHYFSENNADRASRRVKRREARGVLPVGEQKQTRREAQYRRERALQQLCAQIPVYA